MYRRLLKMALEGLELIEKQIGQLDQEMADLLRPYQDQVERLTEVPGLGVDSAQQIIAEVGVAAATFPSAGELSSWVGACPGEDESAGVSHSHRFRRAIVRCGASSIRLPMPRSSTKVASSRSSIADMCRAWGTIKRSE